MSYSELDLFTSNQILTATEMNEIRANQIALKDPPSADYQAVGATDYTTTSSVFVDVDTTNLELTITTNGGDVLVHFGGHFDWTGDFDFVCLDVEVDGTRIGAGSSGIARHYARDNADQVSISFTRLVTGLLAGSHTFTLQWRTNSTATLYAGTGSVPVTPQMWVREVS